VWRRGAVKPKRLALSRDEAPRAAPATLHSR
jgi:hypothetical protein